MSRILADQALAWVMRESAKLKPGECLDLLCKKRNRLVRLTRLDEGFRIEERGFFQEDFQIPESRELKRLLERLLAREFPRSYMLWVFRRKA
ncbi:hypothetical protein [Thermosulfuriphilus sp.]